MKINVYMPEGTIREIEVCAYEVDPFGRQPPKPIVEISGYQIVETVGGMYFAVRDK